MQASARIQAAIDLIDQFETHNEGGPAADVTIKRYFRSRRYAGSKDRRYVRDLVYRLLRHTGEVRWRLSCAGLPTSPRLMVLAGLLIAEAMPEEEAVALFDGSQYGPSALSPEEKQQISAILDAPTVDMPDWARWNYNEWLDDPLKARFGASFGREMGALGARAPLDLRLAGSAVPGELAGLPTFQSCRWSPRGIRLAGPVELQSLPVYRNGLVEVQDEGSQIAGFICNSAEAETVLDLCAGGGGKTLLMADQMKGAGTIYAYDINPKRLANLNLRNKRYGYKNINIISGINEVPKTIDKVVIDAPCSGTGTWRRAPEQRWRLHSQDLDRLLATQSALLDQGAGFVSRGGQLIYIVCSLLESEAEQQIDRFLARHGGFRVVPYANNWPWPDRDCPPTACRRKDFLLMTPAQHETDGFFVAVMERVD